MLTEAALVVTHGLDARPRNIKVAYAEVVENARHERQAELQFQQISLGTFRSAMVDAIVDAIAVIGEDLNAAALPIWLLT